MSEELTGGVFEKELAPGLSTLAGEIPAPSTEQ